MSDDKKKSLLELWTPNIQPLSVIHLNQHQANMQSYFEQFEQAYSNSINLNHGYLINYEPIKEQIKETLDLSTKEEIEEAKLKIIKYRAIESLFNKWVELTQKIKSEFIKLDSYADFGSYDEYRIDYLEHKINYEKEIIAPNTHDWNFEEQKCNNCQGNHYECSNLPETCEELTIKKLIE